jgi:hypothetical protein
VIITSVDTPVEVVAVAVLPLVIVFVTVSCGFVVEVVVFGPHGFSDGG